MKVKTLSLMAGLGGSLLLGTGAQAGFSGYETHLQQEGIVIGGTAYDVWRVYATFDNPGDTVEALSGNLANQVNITTAGSFYQDLVFGADVEHAGAFDGVVANLEHDTYVTIGSTDTATGVTTSTQGLAGNFTANALTLTNGAWFRTPGDALTQQIATPGAASGVLIGQFTVEAGDRLDGLLRLAGNIDGVGTQIVGTTFSTAVPAPGALALLGLAGLVGRRRRRN